MDFSDSVLFSEPSFLDMDLPRRRPKPDPSAAVTGELAKLEKPPGQLAQEIIAEIDSFHEGIDHRELKHVCAECHTAWPCATHRTIYGESRENCVHVIRPGA